MVKLTNFFLYLNHLSLANLEKLVMLVKKYHPKVTTGENHRRPMRLSTTIRALGEVI